MGNKILKSKKQILVIGSAGKTGKRVFERLEKMDWPVRGGSRSTNPKFDWNDRATWKPALQNIKAVYISFQPDLAVPGSVKIIQEFTSLAVSQGVEQLVLLSGRGEVEAQLCEEIVMNSGIDWTIVRASWFNQNFSEGNFLEAVQAGYVAVPAGDVGEPFVDTDDIADVAVAAFTEEGHNKKIYEVTGPRLLTYKEAVQEISAATGRDIQFEQISMEAYAATLQEYQLPPDIISLIQYLFTEVLDGRNASVTDGIEQALGRKPTDFREYARKAFASGVWNESNALNR
jgi:uncharacterized protein YbjT (DUF2867 family)